jgi:hypothetical protein
MQDASKPIWFRKEGEGSEEVRSFVVGEPKYKIFVATPVHSECSIHYTQALLKFQQQCMINNILVSFSLLKSSLVTQGRNLCVANFLGDKTKFTHMLFVDSDIDFTFESITKLLAADKEVIAIPYPMKTINWDQIYEKVKEGKIKSADDLMHSGYIFPLKLDNMVNPGTTNEVTVTNGILEVSHAPTGCMLIKRQVFDKMIKEYPNDFIDQPTIINGKVISNPNMYNFFDTIHDPVNRKYYGEDFGFCKKWTKIGGKCYVYIDDYISHVGEYQYSGRFKDNLDFSRTVDGSNKTK